MFNITYLGHHRLSIFLLSIRPRTCTKSRLKGKQRIMMIGLSKKNKNRKKKILLPHASTVFKLMQLASAFLYRGCHVSV